MIHKCTRCAGKSSSPVRKGRVIVFLLSALIALSSVARGQLTTSDIVGTVTDSAGAVVPNANVTLSNLATNEKRTTRTSGTGDFSFTLLQPGHYSIAVHAPGFEASVTSDLGVEAGDRARADAHLKLGSETTTIEVEAQTPLLQADNATVSSTVTEKAVQDLPLNGRDFVQLVTLVPGANEGLGNSLTSGLRPDDRRQSSAVSVNGQDAGLNNFIIDGIDDNERVIGSIGVKPSVEAIQEISVQTNSYAPEAGRTAGGVINIITKSGSNGYHGTVYEYFRNDIFDARNVFSIPPIPKAELRQNQFGGSFGGPIIKNKTFIFGDYEGERLVSGGITYTSTVPTLAQYNDIHSIGGGSPQDLVASGNGTAAYPIDPIALKYLMLFPAPNVGGASAISNNFSINPSKTQNSDTYDVRVDQNFNANNLFYAQYTYNNVKTFTPAAFPEVNGVQAGGGHLNYSGNAVDAAQQWIFSFTHVFNSSLVLDLKAAYTRINNNSQPLNYGQDIDTQFGFGPNMNYSAASSGLTPLSITGFNDVGDGYFNPLQDLDNTFQYMGDLSYTHGAHNIKVGASIIRRQARNAQSKSAQGFFFFGLTSDTYLPGGGAASKAQVQQNELASTLVGAMASSYRYVYETPDWRMWEPSFFVQDNWKVNPKLTLVYGLRYDIFTPFSEAHNHISNFDYNEALNSTPATVGDSLKVAGQNGVSSTLNIPTIYSNVAPRLGFSATVGPGTVLRGGYGISFFPMNIGSHADLKNAPFTSVYVPTCESTLAYNIQVTAKPSLAPTITPPCSAAQGQQTTFDQGVPLPVPQNINSPSLSFQAEDPHFRPSMIQQFNLQLEQQFGANVLTIGYVGNIGQHIGELTQDVNVPHPNPGTSPRPLAGVLPNVGAVPNLESEGISNYSGLQTSFQRRFSRGLAFDANYTWSHALSDVLDIAQSGYEGWDTADPSQIRALDYGNSDDDIRNRFAISVNYELPFGKTFTGIRKVVFSNWQVNGISAWQSGKSFTVVNGTSAGGYANRANPKYGNGADRPNQIGSATLAHKTLTEYFNTAAFVPQPTLGTVGTEARNQLYGPHFRHVDFSIFKDFSIKEKTTLEFRAEAFNISNTPSYFISNTNATNETLGNASFGQVTQADPNYNPRQIQFALRLRR